MQVSTFDFNCIFTRAQLNAICDKMMYINTTNEVSLLKIGKEMAMIGFGIMLIKSKIF